MNYRNMMAVTLSDIKCYCFEYVQSCKLFINEHKIEIITYTTDILVSHPFIVLRRQCQVRADGQQYHTTPLTLVPVVLALIQRRGIKVLFKGLFSVIVLCSVKLGMEKLMSKLTGWPSKLPSTWHINKDWLLHFLLKSSVLILTAPIYSATVINTVAVTRDLTINNFTTFQKYDFPLAFWQTMFPTVAYGVLKYSFTQAALGLSAAMLFLNRCFNDTLRDSCRSGDGEIKFEERQDIRLKASVLSYLSAEIIFYPLETIVHRLILQGRQMFTNDLDCGTAVVQVVSTHDGFLDCCDNIMWLEGKLGLYKGFGALITQAVVYHYCIKFASFMWHYIRIYKKTFAQPPSLTPASSELQSKSQESKSQEAIQSKH